MLDFNDVIFCSVFNHRNRTDEPITAGIIRKKSQFLHSPHCNFAIVKIIIEFAFSNILYLDDVLFIMTSAFPVN